MVRVKGGKRKFFFSKNDKVKEFRLLEGVGVPGEQGEVWVACHDGAKVHKYAIKLSKMPMGADDVPEKTTVYKTFSREFYALESLRHSNIIQVYFTGIHEKEDGAKYPYYVMEYLGEKVKTLKDIDKYCTENKLANEKTPLLLQAFGRIASALHYAHSHKGQIIHRDLKASNILVFPDGDGTHNFKLIDFGFAVFLSSASSIGSSNVARANSSRNLAEANKRSKKHDWWQLAGTFCGLLPLPEEVSASHHWGQSVGSVTWPIDPAEYKSFHDHLKKLSDLNTGDELAKFDIVEFYDQATDYYFRAKLGCFPPSLKGTIRLLSIPELSTSAGLIPAYEAIRIPPRQLVLYTERVKELISQPRFVALGRTKQLGFTNMVYPGAQGTRLEHALGVYNLACRFVLRMSGEPRYRQLKVEEQDVVKFLLGALLHDIGHSPYAHQIEEFREVDFTKKDARKIRLLIGEGAHVVRGRDIIIKEFAPHIESNFSEFEWGREDFSNLLDAFLPIPESKTSSKRAKSKTLSEPLKFFSSLLSGGIDLDKLDYVERDAYHCGVPYGNYLDIDRILDTLRVVQDEDDETIVAFEERGMGSLEQLATSRHQLYAYVYWHRAVRSATTMFKHAFHILQSPLSQKEVSSMLCDADSDDALLDGMCEKARVLARKARRQNKIAFKAAETLLKMISGDGRGLYKTVVELRKGEPGYKKYRNSTYLNQREMAKEIYRNLAGNGVIMKAHELKEHNILIDVRQDNPAKFQHIRIWSNTGLKRLGDKVPLVARLEDDFEKLACKVRIFVNPDCLTSEFRTREKRLKICELI